LYSNSIYSNQYSAYYNRNSCRYLADKIGKEKVVLLSYGIFAVSSILMVVSINNISFAYVLAGMFGLYIGISETVQRAKFPGMYQGNREEQHMGYIVL
jgi:MFS family permease